MSDDDSDLSECINHLFWYNIILFVYIALYYYFTSVSFDGKTRESRSCKRRNKM